MQIMQHRIAVIPDRHWSTRFQCTCNQFKYQISEKINTQLEIGIVVHYKSSNAIGMFTLAKREKPHKARFLCDCAPRNLLTDKDRTRIPSMQLIIDVAGSRHFRCKLGLADRYHNIRIHPELVKDSTFCCHMRKYDS